MSSIHGTALHRDALNSQHFNSSVRRLDNMRTHCKFLTALAAVLFAASFSFAQDAAPAPPAAPDSGQMMPGSPDDPPAPPAAGWGRGGMMRGHHRMGEMDRGMGFGGMDRGMGFGGMRGRGEHGFMLARLLNNPDLRQKAGISDEQAAKIRQQYTDFRKSEIRTGADLRIKRLELSDLISAEKPDRAAIDRKLQEVGAAQLAREKSAIDFHLAMRDALTPEQRQKLRQLAEESHRGMFGPGRQGRRGPGGMGMRMRQQGAPSTAPAPAPNPPSTNQD
jgi:Spy/CpxP family protein refolding chaperone